MGLKIFTNEGSGREHGGNPDRDDPSQSFDRPAKHLGTIDVAKKFAERTNAARHSERECSLDEVRITESMRLPSTDDLLRVHTAEYLRQFQAVSKRAEREGGFHELGPEASVSRGTYAAALCAVGASMDMVDHILHHPGESGFSVVWPPGHHAEPHQAMGFCYLNNVAVAALYARDHEHTVRPGHPNRVLVIDIDHHAGNGTRSALVNQENILVVDVDYEAAYDETTGRYIDFDVDPVTGEKSNSGKEYPYRKDDASIGAVAYPITQGSNIVELRFPFTSAQHLVDGFTEKALPRIQEFKPDVILWSLGIDSALGDHLGGLGHIPGSFYTLIRGLRLQFPEARHGGVLEGGYDEVNWYRVLPTCLAALHHNANDAKNHSRFFARNRERFETKG